MDRHTCRLCFRRFSNGRALGGHMRSHVASAAAAAAAAKPQLHDPASPYSSVSASHRELEEEEAASEQVVEVAEQAAAALMAGTEGGAAVEEAKQLVYYGLRENPRKSFRLVDPEFSPTFQAADYAGGSSVVLQDRESETESSKPPVLRLRSKRRRREPTQTPATRREPSFEPEPVSSISDATPEEDVARSLMMLSRDVWTSSSSPAAKSKSSNRHEEEEDDDGEDPPSDDDSEEELVGVVRSRRGGRSRYQCGTCRKVFRSYQALGGHRASHKKARACAAPPPSAVVEDDDNTHPHLEKQIHDADSEVNAAPWTCSTERRIHECPVCFRVFSSGQALGGHKRSHLAHFTSNANRPPVTLTGAGAATGVAATTATAAGTCSSPTHGHRSGKLVGECLIDLNLPPPVEEEVDKCEQQSGSPIRAPTSSWSSKLGRRLPQQGTGLERGIGHLADAGKR